MKKLIIVSLMFSFFLHSTLHSALCATTTSYSFWTGIVNKFHTYSDTTKVVLGTTLTKLKNLHWTKTNIAKVGAISAAAAVAVWGIRRLTNYFFRRQRQAGTDNNRQTQQIQPPIPPVQPALPVVHAVVTGTPHGTVVSATNAVIQGVLAPAAAVIVPGAQPTALPTNPVQTQPGIAQVDVPAPVLQAAPQPILPAEPVFAAATEENLAAVPYFANPAHHVIEPVDFENPDNQAHVTIQQMRVLNQFEQDAKRQHIGGGNTSCGYQAGLKNAPALAGLIQGHDTADMLTDSQVAMRLFNPDPADLGLLRCIINNKRIKTALKNFYSEHLRAVEPVERISEKGNTREIRAIYNRRLNELLEHTIEKILNNSAKTHKITEQEVIDALKQVPLASAPCDEQTIRRYFDFSELPLRISRDAIPRAWSTYSRVAGAPNDKWLKNGDWLNSEDIQHLLEQRNNDMRTVRALDDRAVAVSILESTEPDEAKEDPDEAIKVFLEPPEPDEAIKVIDDKEPPLRNLIQSGRLPKRRIYAFILGSTNQETRSLGHWVTMILELAHNRRRYTIANSADNNISMFDQFLTDEKGKVHHINPCFNMIRYLEGNNAANLVRPSEVCKQRILMQLRHDIEQCQNQPNDKGLKAQLEKSIDQFQNLVNDYTSFGGPLKFAATVSPLIYNLY